MNTVTPGVSTEGLGAEPSWLFSRSSAICGHSQKKRRANIGSAIERLLKLKGQRGMTVDVFTVAAQLLDPCLADHDSL